MKYEWDSFFVYMLLHPDNLISLLLNLHLILFNTFTKNIFAYFTFYQLQYLQFSHIVSIN
jgi:hypothetical protein